jgi:hypothetical protein
VLRLGDTERFFLVARKTQPCAELTTPRQSCIALSRAALGNIRHNYTGVHEERDSEAHAGVLGSQK